MKTKKQSWSERIKKRNKMGFSLVELIVVIAIMAIMTAVLAPSLLSYTERSRAQRDDSAMSEVVNSIMLALADQNVYDEVLCYTCDNIKSCYVDKTNPAESNRIETKNYGSASGVYENGDHYIYGDNERLSDESCYWFDGLMRGMTITFEPERSSNKTAFVLYNGYINAAGHATGSGLNYLYGSCPDTEKTSADMVTNGYTENMMLLGNMHSFDAPNQHYLYNRIRSTVGDRIELTSQTYRNSCYTVFIRIGTTGGSQADKQDAIMVYGQWGGTNLSSNEAGQGAGSTVIIGGELPSEEGWPITWNMAEIVNSVPVDGIYYKVSDLTPSRDRMARATVSSSLFTMGPTMGVEVEGVQMWLCGDSNRNYGLQLLIVEEDNFSIGSMFIPEAGVYVAVEYGTLLGQDVDITLGDAANIAHTDTINDSWEEIQAHIEAGDYATRYSLGDTKTITLTDGATVVMEIVAFNADTKADGTTSAITWMSKRAVTLHQMNSTETNAGGWEASEMRAWLQNDFYDTLPSDVKGVIESVNKTYYDYATSSTKVCVDSIWIPSYREVVGHRTHEDAGVDYTAYFSDADDRIKTTYDGCGLSYWWLRSSRITKDYTFAVICPDGNCYTDPGDDDGQANVLFGVVFGFCM